MSTDPLAAAMEQPMIPAARKDAKTMRDWRAGKLDLPSPAPADIRVSAIDGDTGVSPSTPAVAPS